jgi:hypothetical protein
LKASPTPRHPSATSSRIFERTIERVVAVLEIYEGMAVDITDSIREAVEAQRVAA